MFTTIITDCKGENEAGRQITRYHALGLGPASLVGVDSGLTTDATIEGAGNLIDILDASEGKEGVVVLNAAPRGDVKHDGENGTRFCYFWYKETLVISTIRGYCLSLLSKFGITNYVNVLETRDVLENAHFQGLISVELVKHISQTQFRSFEFVPRVARWLTDNVELPSHELSLTTVPELTSRIWCIDAFGNAKTSIAQNEITAKIGERVRTNIGEFIFYNRLKDVPEGETALYIGSSGFGDNRFIEIATQKRSGSAQKTLGLSIGQEITVHNT